MTRKKRNQKEVPTPKTEVGKTKLTKRYHIVYMSFSIGGHSVTELKQKYENVHKTNGPTTVVSP